MVSSLASTEAAVHTKILLWQRDGNIDSNRDSLILPFVFHSCACWLYVDFAVVV